MTDKPKTGRQTEQLTDKPGDRKASNSNKPIYLTFAVFGRSSEMLVNMVVRTSIALNKTITLDLRTGYVQVARKLLVVSFISTHLRTAGGGDGSSPSNAIIVSPY